MKYILSIGVMLCIWSCFSNKNEIKSSEALNKNVLETYLKSMAQTHAIPGMAVAIIKDDQVYYQGYFGLADLESRDSIDDRTIFRIYSTTKLLTSTGIFQLIAKGKIALNDKINTYVEGLPPSWNDIEIQHLLTHSSGLPDIIWYDNQLGDQELINKMGSDGMVFKPGEQFWYNQTNYWLLSRAVEKITGMSFESFIIQNQLSGDSTHSFFSSNSAKIIPHRANKYEYNFEKREFEKTTNNDGRRAHPGNGLNITLNALIAWNKKLDDNQLLDSVTKVNMWRSFEFGNKKDKFRYGWGDYTSGSTESIGFTGGGVSGFRKFTKNNLSILFLSNGYKYFPVHDLIINHLAGLVDSNLLNPESLVKETIQSDFILLPIQQALLNYQDIRKQNPNLDLEGILNSLGYALMKEDRVKDAIEVLAINVEENPNSSNVYDSYAEAYFKNRQYEQSLKYYKKSLELDPTNNNAVAMIEEINQHLSNKK